MTTLTLNIKDDRKVEDVLRFLRDIDFLDVLETKSSRPVESPLRSLFGSLSRFANPDRIQEESGAWYEASRKKHDTN
jgi:hypothetical protein